MSHKFLFSSSFTSLLLAIDLEFVAKAKTLGCPDCGGNLHQADYPRSPIGIPKEQRAHYELRLSLCCSQCRKRVTPPSVRFFGRRWFPAPYFLFISLLRMRINEQRLQQLKRHFGIRISMTTWKRWQLWWRTQFTKTAFWMQAKGQIPADRIEGIFPRHCLTFFTGHFSKKFILLLQFLSPLTAGFLRAV
jgi:hypothetical protein